MTRTTTATVSTSSKRPKPKAPQASDDIGYHSFLTSIQAFFIAALAGMGAIRLFKTDAEGLFELFLSAIPPRRRQHYACHSCRHFVERFGGLVSINELGETDSVLWGDAVIARAPKELRNGLLEMAQRVRSARVAGVFFSSANEWGTHETAPWRHMAIYPPAGAIYLGSLKTSSQAAAEKTEDFKNVARALAEFPLPAVKQALRLLKTDSLFRSEKVIGPASWLADLHEALANALRSRRDNVTWRAVSLAPPGYCHPRSSMIGTLLEDIINGVEFSEVNRRFREKMNPAQYQRPQAAPTAGNIAQAEKAVLQLGIERSLERRFARVDELKATWIAHAPRVVRGSPTGVFSHLAAKGKVEPPSFRSDPPTSTVTWAKFLRDVLPSAVEIFVRVPRGLSSFCGFLTATHADAPPILQWDREDARNPVSWYLYVGGSRSSRWGLEPDVMARVPAISLLPSMWNGGFEHQGKGVAFILEGARDAHLENVCLFPEILKSELHPFRATLESFSASRNATGADEGACGIMFREGSGSLLGIRVVEKDGGQLDYAIDRWE